MLCPITKKYRDTQKIRAEKYTHSQLRVDNTLCTLYIRLFMLLT